MRKKRPRHQVSSKRFDERWKYKDSRRMQQQSRSAVSLDDGPRLHFHKCSAKHLAGVRRARPTTAMQMDSGLDRNYSRFQHGIYRLDNLQRGIARFAECSSRIRDEHLDMISSIRVARLPFVRSS